jgi:fatty-acyl-CoA synthase
MVRGMPSGPERTPHTTPLVPVGTLPELFASAARRGGMLTVIADRSQEMSVSYEEIVDRASRWAAGLAEHGVTRGDRVCLLALTGFDFAVGCQAIWRRGATVVPIPPKPGVRSGVWRFSPDDVERLAEWMGAKHLIVGADDPPLDVSLSPIPVSSLEGVGVLEGELPNLGDVALIQFTSGSTRRPRAVALTHEAIARQAQIVCARLGPKRDAAEHRLFSWLPMYHDLGFINYLVRPMAAGSSTWLLRTSAFVRDPLAWVTEMSRVEATMCAAPNFAYGLVARRLEKEPPTDVDLAAWSYAGVGGEPVRKETLRRFADAAAPLGFHSSALAPGYGLAEATCTVTTSIPGEGYTVDELDRDALGRDRAEPSSSRAGSVPVVSVGRPLDGIEVVIEDVNGESLPERSVGEIVVRGPCLMKGYVNDPAETKLSLRGGGLRTGDRGYVADGRLFVTGRVKDMIVINGFNYYAEEIERVAEGVECVRKGACAAFAPGSSDRRESFVLLAESRAIDSSEVERCTTSIRDRVWAETGVAPEQVVLVPPGTLPKTSSGKLQRGAARRLYESGSLVPPT